MGSKTLFLCAVLMFVIAANCFPSEYLVPVGSTEDQEWDYYKTFFKKTYDTPEENAKRKVLYFKAKAQIEEHNKKFEAGEVTYKQAINKMTDLTEEEFKKQYLSGIQMPETKRIKRADSFTVPEGTSIDDEWALFKKRYNKHYEGAEDAKRKGIYIATKKEVEDHNKLHAAGQSSFTKVINEFADMTQEEFRETHTGVILPTQSS